MSNTNRFAGYNETTLRYLAGHYATNAQKHMCWEMIVQLWRDLETDADMQRELDAMLEMHRRMVAYYQNDYAAVGDEQGRRDMHAETRAQNAQYEATYGAQYEAMWEDLC